MARSFRSDWHLTSRFADWTPSHYLLPHEHNVSLPFGGYSVTMLYMKTYSRGHPQVVFCFILLPLFSLAKSAVNLYRPLPFGYKWNKGGEFVWGDFVRRRLCNSEGKEANLYLYKFVEGDFAQPRADFARNDFALHVSDFGEGDFATRPLDLLLYCWYYELSPMEEEVLIIIHGGRKRPYIHYGL